MFYIDETRCAGCGKCMKTCQSGAISFVDQKANINNKLCNDCGMCYQVCPNGAVVEVRPPATNYQKDSRAVQTGTGTDFSMESKYSGIFTVLAGIATGLYDLIASMAENRVSGQKGPYRQFGYGRNRCGYWRGRGSGRKGRGRGKGRFY